MMNVFKPFAFLAALFFFGACSTEVNLESEWKDIPIVYGFISVQDTAHYVRVQKAFLEPGGDALQIAQVSDSIYYDDVAVTLENRTKGTSFVLERVTGAEEGIEKEPGIFATEPHYLYKLSANEAALDGGDELLLRVDRGDELLPAIAETTVLGEIDSISSSPFNVINSWRYTQVQSVVWRPGPNAQIFDVRIVFNYREVMPGSGEDPVKKTVEWEVGRALLRDDPNSTREKIDISGQAFFGFLGDAIPPSEGEIRIFDGMDIYITGAGQELRDYVRVAQANTGITSAQNIPVYTNVEEGLGVFTSRFQLVRRSIRLAGTARDSLQNGIYTQDINFN